jgi:ABC-type nitrate/sulfonate/bicarbonate transport system substrate-binding protein
MTLVFRPTDQWHPISLFVLATDGVISGADGVGYGFLPSFGHALVRTLLHADGAVFSDFEGLTEFVAGGV